MSREVVTRTIAAVLGGIVLAIFWYFWGSIGPALGLAFLWALNGIGAVFMWLFGTVTMPRWLAIILSVFFGVTVLRKALAYWNRPAPMKEITFVDFVEFERFGIVWRWSWHRGVVNNLIGYCPRCDRMIRYSEDSSLFNPDPTEFFCPQCKTPPVPRPGKYRQTVNDVAIEIDHAVRTGEWKRYIKHESST